MTKGWETVTLASVCTKVTDGTHDTPEVIESGFPLIKGKDISKGFIDFENCDHVSEAEHLAIIKRSKPEKGDVLFANIGNSIGDCVYVNTDRPFSIKNVALFKPDYNKIVPRFLYYIASGERFIGEILAGKSGAAQPFVSLAALRRHPVVIPPLPIQQKIAGILAAYDDLIENNLKRIKLLEEMAQITYEEWFVRLRFPGYESAPINPATGLPEGWINKEVGSFGELKGGKQLPKDRFIDKGNVPVFGGAGIMGRTDVKNASEYIISVGRVGAYCGKFVAHRGEAWINNNASYFILNPDTPPEWFFITLKNLDLDNIRKGAAQPFVSNSDIEKLPILYAGDVIVSAFQQIISPIFLAIESYQKQCKYLREARDILLPRLMKGVIDVESYDPARLLKEAA